jgi:Calx-beta domain
MAINNRHRRYFCTNVSRCPYAARDYVYSYAAFEAGSGLCIGSKSDGCGQLLKEGEPYDPRPSRLALTVFVLLLCAGGGFAIKHFAFPDPINGITFVAPETRLTDATTDTVVHVQIKRQSPADNPVEIRYRAEPLTATAGQDYEDTEGMVTIAAGKRDAEIALMVHPDPSNAKPDRSFAVVLTNVEGRPRHYVTIAERKIDPAEEQRVRAVVRSASRLAMDIADGMVRRKVFTELLAKSRSDPALFSVAQTRLRNAQDDLSRARESYVEALRSLRAFQPRMVFDAITVVSENQEKAGFHQQSKATGLMKGQFQEFAKDGRTYLDKWSDDLSHIVPPASRNEATKQI